MPDRSSVELGRGAVRGAVIWDAVRTAVNSVDTGEPLNVVDLGGGTGGLAVRVAELGHRVVVVDPSPDALASLHRRAVESEVSERVQGVQGDATDLLEHVRPGAVDLVLCHGVLEIVEDPDQALDGVRAALRPGGALSVLVAGRLAAVLARALAGQLARAQALLDARADRWDLKDQGSRRYSREEIEAQLRGHGFEVERVDAVRVFADLIPSALVDTEPGARQALLDLERAVSVLPEFSAVASQLHVLARR